MFGLIVSGRPVITEGFPLTETQLGFNIPFQPAFAHIVVFLLPGNTLPPEIAAAVHIQMPDETSFRLRGALNDSKQSAIFKVRDPRSDNLFDGNVAIVISVEPIGSVEEQVIAARAGKEVTRAIGGIPGARNTKELAKKIIENAFEFLASFGSDVVPLKAFEEWWKKFERRVDLDPSFLEQA